MNQNQQSSAVAESMNKASQVARQQSMAKHQMIKDKDVMDRLIRIEENQKQILELLKKSKTKGK